jgi:hypothetical protein
MSLSFNPALSSAPYPVTRSTATPQPSASRDKDGDNDGSTSAVEAAAPRAISATIGNRINTTA